MSGGGRAALETTQRVAIPEVPASTVPASTQVSGLAEKSRQRQVPGGLKRPEYSFTEPGHLRQEVAEDFPGATQGEHPGRYHFLELRLQQARLLRHHPRSSQVLGQQLDVPSGQLLQHSLGVVLVHSGQQTECDAQC